MNVGIKCEEFDLDMSVKIGLIVLWVTSLMVTAAFGFMCRGICDRQLAESDDDVPEGDINEILRRIRIKADGLESLVSNDGENTYL